MRHLSFLEAVVVLYIVLSNWYASEHRALLHEHLHAIEEQIGGSNE